MIDAPTSVRAGHAIALLLAMLAALCLGHASLAQTLPDDGSSGCVRCHSGIEEMHPEAELSCVDCHGGDASARSRRDAHVAPRSAASAGPVEHLADMDTDLAWRQFRNPMDLRVVERTCAECHPKLVSHLASSLHGTTSGHLSDGFYEVGLLDAKRSAYAIFGESRAQGQGGEVDRLVPLPEFIRRSGEQTLAQHYPDLVRKECMQCHLYSEGRGLRGRVGFDGDYRGQGCAACHVAYDVDGLSRSRDAQAVRLEPGHPRAHVMTKAPSTETCTSCHYGDASIGMQFRGLSQLPPRAVGGPDVAGSTDRLLNRSFYMNDPGVVPADVHHRAGMHCVDCHTLGDVMGDGDLHGNMEHAVEVWCQGCHGTFEERSQLLTERGNRIRNLFRRGESVFLRSKVTGEEHRVVQLVDVLDPSSPDHNPRAVAAMTPAHADIECYTCHSGWNPNFLGFHFYRNEALTQLDLVSGRRTAGRVTVQEKVFATWKSFYAGLDEAGRVAPYLTGFSSMGTVDAKDGQRVLDQVMPVTARGLSGMTMVHHQLHSVQSSARACVECHRSAATWGLGSPNFRLTRGLAFVAGRRGIEVVALAREQLSASVPLNRFVLPDVVDLELDVDPLQGHARILYASEGARGIHVLDVVDPLHPRRIAFVATPSPRGMARAGDYLYCADGWAGLSIFDVSAPEEIHLVGRAPTFDAHEVRVSWPFAYVADGVGGLAIVDVRDATRPRVVGGLETRPAGVTTSASGSGESQVIDLRLLFQNSRPQLDETGAPAGDRSPARHLCAMLDAEKGLILVDVTEAQRPEVLWPPTFGHAGLLPSGPSIEYRSVSMLSHVDLASPQGGRPIVESDYVYLLQELRRGGGGRRSWLYVLDVSDPTAVVSVARTRVGAATEMLVPAAVYIPPFLETVLLAAGQDGVSILDVSSSNEPRSQGVLTTMRDAYAVVLEEFPMDRMVDEAGRELKDVSHAASRWLNKREVDAVLGVSGEALGTLGPERLPSGLPGERTREFLETHDEDGDGWLSADEWDDEAEDGDLDGNGFISLLELAHAQLSWVDALESSSGPERYQRTRVDSDGDLARLLDGIDANIFDLNGDHELDQREMEAAFFAALDLSGNERLDRDELSRHPGPLRRMRYGNFDGLVRSGWRKVATGGFLHRRDFDLRPEDWDALDVNDDGVVQLPVPADPERQRRGYVPQPSEWPTRQPRATGLPPDITAEALLTAFDRDGDGWFSRIELDARPDLFVLMDRDGDGRGDVGEIAYLLRLVSDGGVDVSPDTFELRWDLDRDGRIDEAEMPLDWEALLRMQAR
ncbi:MAG: hypothetical protein ACI80N_003256 [Gammaproteobacteria bacterium]